MDKRSALIKSLADKRYRHEYVEAHVAQDIAFQIRALRDSHGWKQEQLAEKTGKDQPTISQLENPDYGRHSLSTLKKLAGAFDVALIVRFAPFSELVQWTVGLTLEQLAPPSYDEERQSGFANMGIDFGVGTTATEVWAVVTPDTPIIAAESESLQHAAGGFFVRFGQGASYEAEVLRKLAKRPETAMAYSETGG